MIKKKIYRIILVAALIFAQLPVSTVTANATQSATLKYSRLYLLTGNKAADIVRVALAQKEKKKAELGYTEAWCADFVCDCAYLVGASDVIPTYGSAAGLYQKVLAANGTQVFLPQKGDLVFYYCKVTEKWVHCGIMINSTQSIEGNCSGKVSLLNGTFKDSHGHTLASGDVMRVFIRPAYKKSKGAPPKTVSNNPAAPAAPVVVPDTKTDTTDTKKDTTTDTKTDDTKKTDTKSTDTKKTDTKSTDTKTTDTKKTNTKDTDTKKTDTKTTDTKSTSSSKKTATKKFYKKYAGTYTVNTKESPLIMREKASKTSGIITSIPKGTKVKVTKASGTKKTDWAYVTYKSFKGYLSMEFLKKVK